MIFLHAGLPHWYEHTIQSMIEHHLGVYNVCTLLVALLIGGLLINKKSWRKKLFNHLMGCAIGVFAMGCVLYFIGFWHEGTANNVVASLFRSATAAMEMFVSETELIEVREACKEDVLYMLLFATTHFLAVCISAAFIIRIMGIRFRSYLKMRFARRTGKDVYVFFDLSPEAVNLAKDIHVKRENDPNYQIVFVKTPLEASHLERFSFSHILNFVDSRNETVEELSDLNAFLTYSRKSVTIDMDKAKWDDVVGLKNLHRYVERCGGKQYFLCLSANEENNLSTAVALSKRYYNAKRQHVICRANRDSITESLANLNLRFIDSANLSVLDLKRNVKYQPVSFVKPDVKQGVATKPFKAMIVGFGETGFEAFRFLYEFSAFVGSDESDNPFYCHIIDLMAEQAEDSLYLHCPALKCGKLKEQRANCHIAFHRGTIESNYTMVEHLIEDIDYIVVSTNDEKQNLSIGITLLNLAYKYRIPANKLGIFIGVNSNEAYRKAVEVANFYNTCGRKDKAGLLFDYFIVPFGANEQLYTYDNIIADELLSRAKEFYFEYQKTSGLLDPGFKDNCEANKDLEWDKRRDSKPTNGELGLFFKNELVQKESQDKANVWHIQTKLLLSGALGDVAAERRAQLFTCIDFVMQKLIQKTEKARKTKESFDSYDFIREQISEYEKDQHLPSGEYQVLFAHLAQCEHLRWVASNQVLGYRPYPEAKNNEKHYLSKKHACMVSNAALLSNPDLRDTIKYDYNTILVSMKGGENK